jgi:hypothetical protein
MSSDEIHAISANYQSSEERWEPTALAFESDGFEQRRILRELFSGSNVAVANYWSPLSVKRALEYGERAHLLHREAGDGYSTPHRFTKSAKGRDLLEALEEKPPSTNIPPLNEDQKTLLRMLGTPTKPAGWPRSALLMTDKSAYTVAVFGDFASEPRPWPPLFSRASVFGLRDAQCIASDFPDSDRRDTSFYLTDIGRACLFAISSER